MSDSSSSPSSPSQNPPQVRRVAIVGLGLIGTSLGLGLRVAMPQVEVIGFDTNTGTAKTAQQRGAVTALAANLRDACYRAELVLVAVPLKAIRTIFEQLAEVAPADTVVTDTAGCKRAVVKDGEELLGDRFVGGHPMAGSERSGPEAASANLFEGAPWLLTPGPKASDTAITLAKDMACRLGAIPHLVEPDHHDRIMAFLSQVPHVVAFALSAVVRNEFGNTHHQLAGGSYRSITRVAHSPPEVWTDLLLANGENAASALDALIRSLCDLKRAIARQDRSLLEDLLRRGYLGT